MEGNKVIKNSKVTCIVPICTENEMHEFVLIREDGVEEARAFFSSREIAVKKAAEEFPDIRYFIQDVTEAWYVNTAIRYLKRIKKLKTSLKKSYIVLDMSRMYYNRTPENWYTYIPFEYKGQQWEYRENAGGEWISKIK